MTLLPLYEIVVTTLHMLFSHELNFSMPLLTRTYIEYLQLTISLMGIPRITERAYIQVRVT